MDPTFSVTVIDMYHYGDPSEHRTIDGFTSLDAAREYARRRTRDSLEELRGSVPIEGLRSQWYMFGEDCCVIGGTYCGAHELDFFIAHPATPEERDWADLTPDPQMRALLKSVDKK